MVLGSSLGMVLGISLGIDVGASVGPVVLVGKVGLLPAPGPHAAAIESVRTAPRINRILFKAQSSLVRQRRSIRKWPCRDRPPCPTQARLDTSRNRTHLSGSALAGGRPAAVASLSVPLHRLNRYAPDMSKASSATKRRPALRSGRGRRTPRRRGLGRSRRGRDLGRRRNSRTRRVGRSGRGWRASRCRGGRHIGPSGARGLCAAAQDQADGDG